MTATLIHRRSDSTEKKICCKVVEKKRMRIPQRERLHESREVSANAPTLRFGGKQRSYDWKNNETRGNTRNVISRLVKEKKKGTHRG